MALSLGSAILYFKGDKTDLTSAIQATESQVQSSMGRMSGAVEGFSSRAGGFLRGAFQFAVGGLIQQGISGITGAIGNLASGMISGNAAFEQYETRFGVMLGSVQAAKDRMAELAQFGASTPFDLPGVVEADTILQGFGLHAADTAERFGFSGQQIRTIAGDVASGTGASFQEMALLIGKFSTGATGEAIARMMELGITSRDELSSIGLEFSKSGQLLSPLPEAMEGVLTLMQAKYGGLMDAQSSTFSGMMSNLQDWMGNAARTLGQPTFEILRDKLGDLLVVLDNPAIQSALVAIGETLGSVVGSAISFVTDTAIPAFISGWQLIQPAIAAVIPVFSAFASAAQLGFQVFIELASQAVSYGANIGAMLADGIMSAASYVVSALSYIGNLISYWLMPGSPPKLLPDLDDWGREAAQVYLDSWGEAEFGVFDRIGRRVETALRGLVDSGLLPEDGLVPMLLGSRAAIADALSELARTGTVSETAFRRIRDSAGAAGEQVDTYFRALVQMTEAQNDAAAAQAELNAITERYDAQLAPLESQLRAIQDAQQTAREDQQLAELEAIASGFGDPAAAAEARARIDEILLQRRIRTIKAQQQAEEGAAQAQIDAAEARAQAAQDEIARQERLMQIQDEQNALMREQADLLKQIADAQAAAAQAAVDAQWEYIYALADTDEKLAMLREQQAGLTEQDAEYWRLQQKIDQLEAQKDTTGAGGGGGGGGGMDAAAQAAERAAEAQRQYAYSIATTDEKLAMLREEQSHYTQDSEEYWRIQSQITNLEGQKAKEVEASAKAAEQATEAQHDYEYSLKNTADKLADKREQLAGVEVGSVEYYRLLGEINQLEQQQQREMDASAAAQDKATKAKRDYEYATADTAGKLAILRGELANTEQGSADYYAILTQMNQLEQQQQRELAASTAAVGGKASGMGGAAKAAGGMASAIGGTSGSLADLQAKIAAGQGPMSGLTTQVDTAKTRFADFKDRLFETGQTITSSFNPAVQIAQQIIDVFRQGIATLATIFQPVIAAVQTFVSGLVTAFQEGGIVGAAQYVIDALSAISPVFAILRGAVEAALPPIQSIVQSVFGIIAGFIQTNGASIVQFVQTTWDRIWGIVQAILPPIQTLVTTIFGAIATFLETHSGEIQAVLTLAWETIQSVIDGILTVIEDIIIPGFTAIATFISDHATEIQTVLSGAWDIIKGIIEVAMNLIKGIIDTITAAISGDWSGAWNAIKTMIDGVWTGIKSIIDGALTIIKGVLSTAWDAIKTLAETIWNGIKTKISEVWDGIKSKITEVVDGIKTKLGETWDAIKTKAEDIFNGVKTFLGETWTSIKNTVTELWGQIKDAIVQPIQDAYDTAMTFVQPFIDLGKALVGGIADGINIDSGFVVDAARAAVDAAKAAAQDEADAHSPARAFSRDVGQPISMGVAVGIEEMIPRIAHAARQMVDAARGTAATATMAGHFVPVAMSAPAAGGSSTIINLTQTFPVSTSAEARQLARQGAEEALKARGISTTVYQRTRY